MEDIYKAIRDAKQVNRWLNSLTGRNFSGGTSVGKSPQTLVLDVLHQDGAISVSSKYGISVRGKRVNDKKEFKSELEKHYKF